MSRCLCEMAGYSFYSRRRGGGAEVKPAIIILPAGVTFLPALVQGISTEVPYLR